MTLKEEMLDADGNLKPVWIRRPIYINGRHYPLPALAIAHHLLCKTPIHIYYPIKPKWQIIVKVKEDKDDCPLRDAVLKEIRRKRK